MKAIDNKFMVIKQAITYLTTLILNWSESRNVAKGKKDAISSTNEVGLLQVMEGQWQKIEV